MPRAHRDREQPARYGIGEWYGHSFIHLPAEKRRQFAEIQELPATSRPPVPCPFLGEIPCNKVGGVCSIRSYRPADRDTEISMTPGHLGPFCCTCPNRFHEGHSAFTWAARELLGTDQPLLIGEVGFLRRTGTTAASSRRDVGKIDMILVHPDIERFQWCSLEIQAVYFSGTNMGIEFSHILNWDKPSPPFPVGNRHPDYRSSGPKRLMPQLQIKVPTLRRWGKRMAVVVDEGFYSALGDMDRVEDVSNADIAWFVMRFRETDEQAAIEPASLHYTTLESAVKGLTGGVPLTLAEFEAKIREKLEFL